MIPTISIPFNFLSRPEDRAFIGFLRELGEGKDYPRVALVLLWRDFAQHGGKERRVPLDPQARSGNMTIRVIEEVCEWEGGSRSPGAFVEAALRAQVLKVIDASETEGSLVLADFAAARSSTGSGGGKADWQIKGSHKAARLRTAGPSRADAEQALDLFSESRKDLAERLGKDRLQAALTFLFQVCRIKGWKNPELTKWTEDLFIRADEILSQNERHAIDRRLEWLLSAKNSDEIPGRLDLLINAWDRLPRMHSD